MDLGSIVLAVVCTSPLSDSSVMNFLNRSLMFPILNEFTDRRRNLRATQLDEQQRNWITKHIRDKLSLVVREQGFDD